MKKIVFRCDSSYELGSGHLMRCLSLAHKLSSEITFICRKLSGNLNQKVIQNQFTLIELEDIPGLKIEQKIDEIKEIVPIISKIAPDVVIVDHYGLDQFWESTIKKHCKKLIAIDDLLRTHCSNAVIDTNFRASLNHYNEVPQRFLGPHYALLSNHFLSLKPELYKQFNPPYKLAVFFGGSDIHSMTKKIIDIIPLIKTSARWNIVIGQSNKDKSEIKNKTAHLSNVELHVDIDYFHKIMQNSDLFIGAGGTTNWERAYLGLPSLIYTVADNQVAITKDLAEAGVLKYIGDHEDFNKIELASEIEKLLSSPKQLLEYQNKSLELKVATKLKELISFITHQE